MHIQALKTVLDWSDCPLVEVVPGKVSGVPIVRGSRVPADQVVENYDSGESPEDIAYNFDLNPEDIRVVLAYAASRRTAPRP
jgi:uncharacterized protein (DUF433 family)